MTRFKNNKNILIILLLTGGFLLLLRNCDINKKLIVQNNLLESTQDTLEVFRDSDSLYHAKIQVIETQSVKDFLELQFKDNEIIKLQKSVEEYKSKIKNGGSVTNFTSEVKYDTLYETELIYLDKIVGKDSIVERIVNPYIEAEFGFIKDKTVFQLVVENRYSVVIGEEKQGLFKPSLPYVEVKNENPYSRTTQLRTYQVNNTIRPKRFGIGPQVGVGLTLTPTLYLGVGLSYNLIRF